MSGATINLRSNNQFQEQHQSGPTTQGKYGMVDLEYSIPFLLSLFPLLISKKLQQRIRICNCHMSKNCGYW